MKIKNLSVGEKVKFKTLDFKKIKIGYVIKINDDNYQISEEDNGGIVFSLPSSHLICKIESRQVYDEIPLEIEPTVFKEDFIVSYTQSKYSNNNEEKLISLTGYTPKSNISITMTFPNNVNYYDFFKFSKEYTLEIKKCS